MKGRSILLLAISAVLGVLAVGLVHGMSQPVSFAPPDTRKVVIAGLALKFGDRITAEDLRLVDFPSASVPGSAFPSIEELVVQGEPRVALTAIEAGDLVLASKVSGRGGKASLSTVIDPTMRAVTIRVDDVSGTAGFITPSDRVDVMLTRTDV